MVEMNKYGFLLLLGNFKHPSRCLSFVCVCVLLETEPRTLYMLGKSLTIELYAPKICTMGIHTYF